MGMDVLFFLTQQLIRWLERNDDDDEDDDYEADDDYKYGDDNDIVNEWNVDDAI